MDPTAIYLIRARRERIRAGKGTMIANGDLNAPTWIRLKSTGAPLNQISSLCERNENDQLDQGPDKAERKRDVFFEVISKPDL